MTGPDRGFACDHSRLVAVVGGTKPGLVSGPGMVHTGEVIRSAPPTSMNRRGLGCRGERFNGWWWRVAPVAIAGWLACIAWSAAGAPAGEVDASLLEQMADQRLIDPRACGPCAIYHALLFGPGKAGEVAQALPGRNAAEKVRHLLDTYGSLPSTVRPNHSLQNHRGMHWQDAAVFMNAILADHDGPTLASGYLHRAPGEPQPDHLRRVHGLLKASLDAGWPPVVAIRSYVADWNRNRGVVEWRTGESHYVTLTSIGDLAGPEDGGFEFRYADSFRVGIHQGFVLIERQRDFEAQSTVDGMGRWVDGSMTTPS